jgi:hypothetical protein
MGVLIRWVLPSGLTTDYSKTRILKSGQIQGPYIETHTQNTYDSNAVPVTVWFDPLGDRNKSYVIRFFKAGTNDEFEDYTLGFLPPTPREKRLIAYVAGWVPDILKNDLSDFDVQFALQLATNDFNVQPPETNFTIDGFPDNYEQFLVMGTEINIMYQKYLKIAIRDWSYSDMGLSMNIDRGAKIKQAEDDLKTAYNHVIERAKWNFTSAGVGVGTVPLPIGIGASINRGVLQVLDIFNLMGR